MLQLSIKRGGAQSLSDWASMQPCWASMLLFENTMHHTNELQNHVENAGMKCRSQHAGSRLAQSKLATARAVNAV
jgi:hypothetical protein